MNGESEQKHIRWIRFTDHALERFTERIKPLWYSIQDIMDDIKLWWKLIVLWKDWWYKIVGKIWVYTLAKDRIVYDWIIITMYMKYT
jgi:hypothetical protein